MHTSLWRQQDVRSAINVADDTSILSSHRKNIAHQNNNNQNKNKCWILKNKNEKKKKINGDDDNNNCCLNNAKLNFINDMNVLNYNGEQINNLKKLQKKKKKNNNDCINDENEIENKNERKKKNNSDEDNSRLNNAKLNVNGDDFSSTNYYNDENKNIKKQIVQQKTDCTTNMNQNIKLQMVSSTLLNIHEKLTQEIIIYMQGFAIHEMNFDELRNFLKDMKTHFDFNIIQK